MQAISQIVLISIISFFVLQFIAYRMKTTAHPGLFKFSNPFNPLKYRGWYSKTGYYLFLGSFIILYGGVIAHIMVVVI